jgi:integrase
VVKSGAREVPSPVMVWTPAQTAVFLDRAAKHRQFLLFQLLAFTGLRRGEAVGLRWVDSGLVFTHPDRTGLHPGWVTEQFHLLAREADLPPIRLHDLRHGAASVALAAGADIKAVSEMLGHSGTAITRDIYTSATPRRNGPPSRPLQPSSPRPGTPAGARQTP